VQSGLPKKAETVYGKFLTRWWVGKTIAPCLFKSLAKGKKMALYKQNGIKLETIDEIPFKLEKDIQTICEKNLKSLLGIDFVRSEFKIGNFRIDSLAFDNALQSFIIIEYKRDKNFSVIDQGVTYLSLMLNNKADIVLEFNELTGKNLKRNDVDWSQSKVIFVSPSFTSYQKEASNFRNLPIELWEIRQFSNSTLAFNQVVTKNSVESINTITKSSEEIEAVAKEIKVYSEDDHLQNGSPETNELYNKLKFYILNMADDIQVRPTKLYIGFITSTNFCDVAIQKKTLKIWINLAKGELDDHKGIARDVSGIGHHGNGDYEIQISDDSNLEYIVSLVKSSYSIVKSKK
jgi:predicted transport protein